MRRRLDPAATTGLALTAAVGVVILGGVLLGAMATMVSTATGLEPADQPIERWADSHASTFVTNVLNAVTDVASTGFIVGLLLVVTVLELRRSPTWSVVGFVLCVGIGETIVVEALKDLADRARPAINPVARTLGPSFPSGHAASAAACLAAVALLLTRNRTLRARAILVGSAVGLAVGVAATRVLLGVHFLTDAVAGLGVGWAWFALCAIVFGGRLLRFGAPLELARRAGDLPSERG